MSEFLVTGATGRVGRHVVNALAEAGHDVRALVREPGNAALPDRVEIFQGDLASPHAVERAARDVEGVYLMWPGLPVEPRVVDAIARDARHVVYLSTDVADLADDEPATSFHQEIERQIRRSGAGWTFVRAIDFAANTLAWAGQIRQGVVRWPYGDAARSLIHERDIADVAVHALTTPGHDGNAYVITGPESITHREQVRVIGEVIGREVRWEDLPAEIAREELTAAWGDAGFVQARLDAWKRFADEPERVTGTVERLLGRPARTFRQWAEDHAADFR
ncbi:NmrA family NAD(P)-binding protein [Spirillospora sp. CA-142024]|uniref:NmrA family NAD(P)-binding protein n=1 Tax=Spirillospora sp. CA-142024 TaxID=3240036 RepID=UPI003D91E136